ncbi:MAG: hypothetical protein HYT15_00675 [Candidatus Magasanikbacteria bacterium]|nr:hypothetical protein [Candidatus Magasanikbacteria bacterium]
MEQEKRARKPEGYLPGVHDEKDEQMLRELEKVNEKRKVSGQKPLSPAEYENTLEKQFADGTGETELSENDLISLEDEEDEN